MITLYSVMADGSPIYMAENIIDSGSWEPDKTKAASAKLVIEDNKSGTLNFTIDRGNEAYDKIKFMKTVIEVFEYVYADDAVDYKDPEEMNVIWRGRAINVEEDIYGNRTFECEGALAFLGDVFQNGYIIGTSTTSGVYTKEQLCRVYINTLLNSPGELNGTVDTNPESSLNGCITSFGGGYNRKVDSKHQIKLGVVDVIPATVYEHEANPEEGQNEPYYSLESDTGIAESVLDRIFATLVEPNGGHLNIRHTVQSMYLDYRGDYLPKREDNVAGYGINILDLTKSIEINKPITAIVPMGKTAVRKSVGVTAKETTTPEVVPEIETLGIGSQVMFTGNYHYVASTSDDGYQATPGLARITNINPSAPHPYHLIHVDNTSNVYGWVNESDIQRINEISKVKGIKMKTAAANIEIPSINDLFEPLKNWFNQQGFNDLTGDSALSKEEKIAKAKEWMTQNGYDPNNYTDDEIGGIIDMMPTGSDEGETETKDKRLYHFGISNNPAGTGVYVINQELYEKYGRIEEAVDFGEVNDEQELLKLAEAWFKDNSFEATSFDVSLLDLGRVYKSGMRPIHLLDLIHVKSEFNDVDEYFPVTKLDIDLINPANTVITCNKRGGEELSTRMAKDIRVQKIEKTKNAINAASIKEIDGAKTIKDFDEKYLKYDIENYHRWALYGDVSSVDSDITAVPKDWRKKIQYNINNHDVIGGNILDDLPTAAAPNSNYVQIITPAFAIPLNLVYGDVNLLPNPNVYYRERHHTEDETAFILGRGNGWNITSDSRYNYIGMEFYRSVWESNIGMRKFGPVSQPLCPCLSRMFATPTEYKGYSEMRMILIYSIDGVTYYATGTITNGTSFNSGSDGYVSYTDTLTDGLNGNKVPFNILRFGPNQNGFNWFDSAPYHSISIDNGPWGSGATYNNTTIRGWSVAVYKTKMCAVIIPSYVITGYGFNQWNWENTDQMTIRWEQIITNFIPSYGNRNGTLIGSDSALWIRPENQWALTPTSLKNAPSRMYIFDSEDNPGYKQLLGELQSTYRAT